MGLVLLAVVTLSQVFRGPLKYLMGLKTLFICLLLLELLYHYNKKIAPKI